MVPTSQIYRGAIPFLIIQLALVVVLIAVPSMVLRTPVAIVNTDDVEIPMAPRGYGDPPQGEPPAGK